MYVHTYSYISSYLYTHIYMYIYVCIHIHIYTCIIDQTSYPWHTPIHLLSLAPTFAQKYIFYIKNIFSIFSLWQSRSLRTHLLYIYICWIYIHLNKFFCFYLYFYALIKYVMITYAYIPMYQCTHTNNLSHSSSLYAQGVVWLNLGCHLVLSLSLSLSFSRHAQGVVWQQCSSQLGTDLCIYIYDIYTHIYMYVNM